MCTDRYFSEGDLERTDDLGFLDVLHTPRLRRYPDLLQHPVAWVVGPPWLGKSTFATSLRDELRAEPSFGGRVTLTRLGDADAGRTVPPPWWPEWAAAPPAPSLWLLDGADEGLSHNAHLIDHLLDVLGNLCAPHVECLRLLVLSRPYAELGAFRDRLRDWSGPVTGRIDLAQYWLSRLDRASAAALVGPAHIAAVEDLIRRNDLAPVAGYPVVLNFLKTYRREAGPLTVAQVWRHVLGALLGHPQSHPRRQFATSLPERLTAASRVAAVLTLTHRTAIRDWSPDPDEPTVGLLFDPPENRSHEAAREACRTALFAATGEPGEFRFAQRNAQDWLTAFALEGLPLPRLRAALIGADGRLPVQLREPARLLRVSRSDAAAHALIERLFGGVTLPTDAIDPGLAGVVGLLDQLEVLASDSSWGLRIGLDRADDLARLRVPGLGSVIADRLRQPERPGPAKHLLLDVAQATGALDAVDAAAALVLNRDQDEDLRYSAAWAVARLGGNAHLLALAEPIGEREDGTDIEGRLRGLIVRELLTRGIWPPWRAALNAPRPQSGVLDSRLVLLQELERGVTLEDARRLLPSLGRLFRRHAEKHQPHHLPGYLTRAVELVLAQTPPAAADVEHLLEFIATAVGDADGWLAARDLAVRLRHVPAARRQLYRRDHEATHGRLIGAANLLEPGDWRWLREQALGAWAGNREVWSETLWLASRARGAEQLSAEEWGEFTALLDEHAPGLRAEADEARRRFEREREDLDRQQQEREGRNPNRRPLAERVREALDRPGLAPPERMLALGQICFAPLSAPQHGNGWGDLSVELRNQVLNACVSGLHASVPTPIPDSGPFEYNVVVEGAVFAHVAGSPGHLGAITGNLIRRWLPTALFARMSGEWAGTIAACSAVDLAATRAALLETIDIHVRRGQHLFVLGQIPAASWDATLTERLESLVRSDALPAPTRCELLEQLAARDPGRAIQVASVWATRPAPASGADSLRSSALNLLVTDSPTALDLIEADFNLRGRTAIEELEALRKADEDPRMWSSWTVADRERLVGLLVRAYPVGGDPVFHGGFVEPAQTLRWLRDRLFGALLAEGGGEASAAAERLAALDPRLAVRHRDHRAHVRANEILPQSGAPQVRGPGALTTREAVLLLDRAEFRLIRSAGDLLDAVVEALGSIDASAGYDLPMLYAAPERGKPDAPRKGDEPRQRLGEDALQAYLRRRLLDGLSRVADGVDVQIFREDVISHRQRLDLRVTAPCHGVPQLATVVIEVKWSDNPETRGALVEQLGDRYLRGEGLTHGVFLVGWSGEWSPGDRSSRRTEIEALRAHLRTQRDGYCAQGQPGAGLTIEPIVLDLGWWRS